MNEILYADGFFRDMLSVTSPKVEAAIFHAIDLLPSIPVLGSTNLPQAIIETYGPTVRKMPVKPFDVIYTILDSGDFLILGLLHQKQAR